MTFLFAGVALDVAQVLSLVLFLLDYLGGIDSSSWTIFLLASITFFGVLRLISGRKSMGFSLFFILGSLVAVLLLGVLFLLFRRRTVAFRTPRIDLSDVGEGLQVGLCFCITCFFYHFLPRV